MSARVRVYGFLALVLAVAGGVWLVKSKKIGPFGVEAKEKGSDGKAKKDKTGEREFIPVELVAAVRGPISSYVSSTGNLRALRDVAVATQQEGIVQRVHVEEGDLVKEGDVLCTLDDAQLRIRLELAKEKMAQAKVQLEKARIRWEKAAVQIDNARTEFERYSKAHREGLVSAQEVAQYKYRLDEFEHDHRVATSEIKELSHRVAELEAEIAQADLELSRTRIRAPFSGLITRRSVELGQRVRTLDALFNLGAFSPMYADIYVSEREAQRVRPGQGATIRLGSDGTAAEPGKVERISPIVDQATGTVKVTVELNPRDPSFRPGAFVRVEVRTDTRNDAVLIPKKALLEEDGTNYVYIAEGEKARRSKVDVGYEAEGMVEVKSGVNAGEKVVTAGQGALKEGSKLRVIES
ncbi:MAG: efflux RND transporter periplasmic adaptor subunit [Bryobacteraceae bacterium]